MTTRNVMLYGTDETLNPYRVLSAGPLTCGLQNGEVRHVKYDGVEVLRGIAFLVRDKNWATCKPRITALEIDERDGGFEVTYAGRCADAEQAFAYQATITGGADGALAFQVSGEAEADFVTNRLGFVVLHPLAGVVGAPVAVEHVDGTVEDTTFPALISPSQPIFDIRALRHQVMPGLWATCTMLGDAFELEDQRNWTDASYKTYVRPLRLPFPYTVAAGEAVVQSVALGFEGAPATVGAAADAPVEVSVGPADGASMPRIGLGVPAGMTAATPELRAAGVQFLVCAFDARRDDIAVLRQHRSLAESVGAAVALELVLPALGDYGEEAKAAARLVAEAGVDVADVAVSPAPYLMSYQPTAEWPDIPPLEECYDAVRAAFPGKPVGGGMFAYFTELNRKRPPAVKLDFVTHTTCPIVHDADDRAVMESLEALPDVIASMRAIVGPVPYRIGPSAIGMRHNPYGAAPVENPDNVRVAMARVDPRQRGLFGAAWNLGYAAEAARGGLEALALSAPVGPFGIVYRRADHAQPYYDDLTDPAVYLVYYVIAAMAAAADKPRLAARNSDRLRVQSVAWAGPDGPVLWLANVTDRPQVVVLAGLEDHTVVVRTLDAATYGQATADRAAFLPGGELRTSAGELTLDAYALAAVEARG